MSTDWLLAITSLVAVIVGPIVTLYVAARQNRTSMMTNRHQIDATIVSTSRQQWIDRLRDCIAEFQGLLYDIRERARSQIVNVEQEAAKHERILFLRSKIALLINPAEEDHKKLLLLLDSALSVAPSQGDDARRHITQLQGEITTTAQTVLKREWERVKRGETQLTISTVTRSQSSLTDRAPGHQALPASDSAKGISQS